MKMKGILLITICCICLTGCKMSVTDIVNIKDAIRDEQTYEDVEVYSEEEMREYALERLKNKYGEDFEFEEEGLKYGYWDKERKDFLYMTGWVHVIGDEEKRCVFKVKEPNDFSDNYEINYYKEEIDSYIRNEWSDLDSDYKIEIDHGLSKKEVQSGNGL